MGDNHEETVLFKVEGEEVDNKARKILVTVYQALKEKGYNPLNQLVGYLLSGDPAYITSHQNARSLIRQVERDELLEEVVGIYLKLAEKDKL
ncbi:MAG: IreB family regulatory phosphoprotein [Firmicutes bacterium]|nr:IreB family regulatory phosphoprotein [Bacillota bacterium]